MAPLFSGAEPLCNFGRRHHEKQFCKNYFEFGPVVQEETSFKIFLIWSSGGPFVHRRGTICAILVEGIVRNRANLCSSQN